MLYTFITMLALGVSTGGCAIFLKALPWPERVKSARAPKCLGGKPISEKPLACPACMSGWSGLCVVGLAWDAGMLGGWRWSLFALAWLVCMGVGSALFAFVNPPMIDLPEAPADLPSEVKSE